MLSPTMSTVSFFQTPDSLCFEFMALVFEFESFSAAFLEPSGIWSHMDDPSLTLVYTYTFRLSFIPFLFTFSFIVAICVASG